MKQKSPQRKAFGFLRGKQKYILWLNEISKEDVPLVGGKNASLGEMVKKLKIKNEKLKINIPDGFALTTNAYWYFLKFNKIKERLKEIFGEFNPESIKSLKTTGREARNLFLKGKFPNDLEIKITQAYDELSKKTKQKNGDPIRKPSASNGASVAIRSSGVAEDQPTTSFAGQFETFLNVSGKDNLLEAIKKCFASSFNDRAIIYREEKKLPQLKFALSVGIQKMVRSDLACSGIIFTLDTETGFKNVILINSIWGVGEMIVKGKITPDEFYVFKPTLKEGFKSIIIKNLGRKTKKYIYPPKFRETKLGRVYGKGGGLKEVLVPKRDQMKFSLTDEEILTLARWAEPSGFRQKSK